MSLFINNHNGPIYNECNVTINGSGETSVEKRENMRAEHAEVVEPVEELKTAIDSILFTKKARKEAKETAFIAALQKSTQGRRDKSRALVFELHAWQDEGYIDAHYNARVMYDELEKLMPMPFGYNAFRKHYYITL